MSVDFFFSFLRMSHLLTLNTEIQKLLPGMSLKLTQRKRALICNEFVKKNLTFLNSCLMMLQMRHRKVHMHSPMHSLFPGYSVKQVDYSYLDFLQYAGSICCSTRQRNRTSGRILELHNTWLFCQNISRCYTVVKSKF